MTQAAFRCGFFAAGLRFAFFAPPLSGVKRVLI
jgi:hypothetical protein